MTKISLLPQMALTGSSLACRHSRRAHFAVKLIAVAVATIYSGTVASTYAGAADIVVDGKTATSVSYNAAGKASIAIAPTVSGVSHNTYSSFSVGKAGADLVNTGVNAKMIVNEVTSSNPSLIQGAISVVGQRANVILANPNGITVNGGSFVNTGHVVLSTGKVSFDDFHPAPGKLQRNVVLTTTGGQIQIGPDGLSGAMLSLDLIAKQLSVAGPVTNSFSSATSVTRLVAGSTLAEFDTSVAPTDNLSNYIAFAATKTSNPGAALIDISRTGSLTSGRIELMVTDLGAGVHLAGKALASVGDFVVQADGKVQLDGAAVQSKGNVVMVAGQLASNGFDAGDPTTIQSNGSTQLQAAEVALANTHFAVGVTDSHQKVTQTGDLIITQTAAGQSALSLNGVAASVTGGIGITTAQDLTASGSKLSAVQNLIIQSRSLALAAGNDVNNNANTASLLESTGGALSIQTTAGTTVSGSTLSGIAGVAITADSLKVADQAGTAQIKSLLKSDGGDITIKTAQQTAVTGSDLLAAGNVAITANDVLVSTDGAQSASVTAYNGGVTVTSKIDITNLGGLIQGKTRDTTNAASLGAITLNAGGNILNQTVSETQLGLIFGQSDDVSLKAGGDITNQAGRVISNKQLLVNAGGTVSNQVTHIGGANNEQRIDFSNSRRRLGLFPVSNDGFSTDYGSLALSQLAYMVADSGMTMKGKRVQNLGGQILVNGGGLQIDSATKLVNQAYLTGKIQYSRSCFFRCHASATSTVQSQGGLISVSGNATLTASESIDNIGGRVLALKNLTLNAPLVHATALPMYTTLSRDSGWKTWFGDQWAQVYAMDDGGMFTSAGGKLSVQGKVLVDGGVLTAADGVEASDGVVTIRTAHRDPVTLSHHTGLTSWLWH